MPEAKKSDKEEGKSPTARMLATVAVVITVVTGAVALLFTFKPELSPCIGAHEVTITGAPVFPDASYEAHLRRKNNPPATARAIETAPDLPGADIRLSYRATGLRGADLVFRWSLVSIRPDRSLGVVDPENDSQRGEGVRPRTCDEVVGHDFFVPIPKHSKPRRYRVVIELFPPTV